MKIFSKLLDKCPDCLLWAHIIQQDDSMEILFRDCCEMMIPWKFVSNIRVRKLAKDQEYYFVTVQFKKSKLFCLTGAWSIKELERALEKRKGGNNNAHL